MREANDDKGDQECDTEEGRGVIRSGMQRRRHDCKMDAKALKKTARNLSSRTGKKGGNCALHGGRE